MMKTYPTQERALVRVEVLRKDQGIWTGVQYRPELRAWVLLFDPLDQPDPV